jgi:hypothetical protein
MSLVPKRIVWDDGTIRPNDFNILHDGEKVGRFSYLLKKTSHK